MNRNRTTTSFFLKLFFANYLWFGVVIILLSVIFNNTLDINNIFAKIFIDFVQAVGIAIFVATIFTFASGTSQFVNKITDLLQNVVIGRHFLCNIDTESKRDVLNNIIKPTSKEMNIYSNIEDYYNTYITQVMNVNKKCVRSNYIMHSRAYSCKNTGTVVVNTTINYRLYPTVEGYNDIQVGFYDFDKLSECKYIRISTASGERKKISGAELNFVVKDTDVGKTRIANVELKDHDKNCSHLDIEIMMSEYGKDHWTLLSFQTLQPTDGFNHYLRCEDDLKISEYATFVHGAKFVVEKTSDFEMHTSCNEWINEGSGFGIVISKSCCLEP